MDSNASIPFNLQVRPPPPLEEEEEEEKEDVNHRIVSIQSELKELKELLTTSKFRNLITSISAEQDSDEDDVDEDDELIRTSNKYLNKILEQTHKLNLLLVRVYRKKFPGLEEQVKDPLLYAKVCQRIGNKTSIDDVQFHDLLPSKSILVLRMTFSDFLSRLKPKNEFSSNTFSRPPPPMKPEKKKVVQDLSNSRQLSKLEMEILNEIISTVFQYEQHKKKILKYVSSQMKFIAPNLSAIVGTTLAAQLFGIAGGLKALARLDSSSIQMLGRSNDRFQSLHGFSSTSLRNRFSGVIFNSDIVQMTPAEYQKRACKMISNKCVMAIRCDRFRTSPDGGTGKKLRAKVISALTKIQAPPPPVQDKPLPVPDSFKKRTKRGGRNARRLKALYGMTEVRSKMNRVAFGEKQVEDFETGETYGLLGAQTGNNSLKLRPKTKVKIKKQLKGDQTSLSSSTPYYGGGGDPLNQVSGLSSSLVFTPVQGISLTNPDFNKKKKRKRNKFFDDLEFKRPQKKRKKD